MTKEELFGRLRSRFGEVLRRYHMEDDAVDITCRSLTPEEAIGSHTKRMDFPILTGKDVMIQAEYRGCKGQAFTDAPAEYHGRLKDVLTMDLCGDRYARSLFLATLNAVMGAVGLCVGTSHCRNDGPEQCAMDIRSYLDEFYPNVKRIGQVGFQPAMVEMLANSNYEVRVMDLNPQNIGQIKYGIRIENGAAPKAKDDIVKNYADIIFCTGSTLANGTIVDYLDVQPEVHFYGITAAGTCALLGLKRLCFAHRYEAS